MPIGSPMSTTDINPILKELYDGQKVMNMAYQLEPALALIPKMTDFEGKVYPIPVIVDGPANASANFSNAQGNVAGFQSAEFLLTRTRYYQLAQIQQEALLAAKSDMGAFVNTLKTSVDTAIRSAANFVGTMLYRSGTGSIAQIGSISTGVITLANPADVVQFQLNQVLQANATDGGSPRSALGYVTALDRMNGKVTVSASSGGSAGTPTSWTANDYLLVQGNNNACMSGFDAWLLNPANVSSSDNFYGVNRSTDSRLSGVYYDGSSQSIEEALISASELVAREGGNPSIALVNHDSFSALQKAMGARAVLTSWDGPAELRFKGIDINGATGTIKVLPSRNCPAKTCYLLEPDSWVLASLGDATQIFHYEDGQDMFRMSTADACEARIGGYLNLGCKAPGHNAKVILGA